MSKLEDLRPNAAVRGEIVRLAQEVGMTAAGVQSSFFEEEG